MILVVEDIIVKVKVVDEKKLKAIIGLDFGDFVVRGFRIMESEYPNHKGDKLWLTPPSYKGGVRYHPIFFVPDKTLWEKLSLRIWDEYYHQHTAQYSKRMGIDPKEIDF